MNYNDWRQNWRKKYENGENLPELWERRISKTYSTLLKQLIFYYKNMITNEVQWEDPRKEKECLHDKNEKITTTEKSTSISDNDTLETSDKGYRNDTSHNIKMTDKHESSEIKTKDKDNSCPSRDKTPHPPVDKSDYRKEILIFHPDKNPGCSDAANEKFVKLAEMEELRKNRRESNSIDKSNDNSREVTPVSEPTIAGMEHEISKDKTTKGDKSEIATSSSGLKIIDGVDYGKGTISRNDNGRDPTITSPKHEISKDKTTKGDTSEIEKSGSGLEITDGKSTIEADDNANLLGDVTPGSDTTITSLEHEISKDKTTKGDTSEIEKSGSDLEISKDKTTKGDTSEIEKSGSRLEITDGKSTIDKSDNSNLLGDVTPGSDTTITSLEHEISKDKTTKGDTSEIAKSGGVLEITDGKSTIDKSDNSNLLGDVTPGSDPTITSLEHEISKDKTTKVDTSEIEKSSNGIEIIDGVDYGKGTKSDNDIVTPKKLDGEKYSVSSQFKINPNTTDGTPSTPSTPSTPGGTPDGTPDNTHVLRRYYDNSRGKMYMVGSIYTNNKKTINIRNVISDLNKLIEEKNITQENIIETNKNELEIIINSMEDFIFGIMSTKLLILFLEKIGIEYNEVTNKWDKNDKVILNEATLSISRFLIYLNLFKYKSRIHDLLDIIEDPINVHNIRKNANFLLEHLKTDPESIENIIDHIKNERKKKSKKIDFIEYWDVRKFNIDDVLNELQKINKPINLQYWDTSNFTSMKNMFSLKDNEKSKKTQSITFMFDVKNIINNQKSIIVNPGIDKVVGNVVVKGIKYWNTSRVTNMSSMFKNNKSFNEKLEWDTSQVDDMSNMFKNATSFNQSVENWNVTKVINMKSMFKNANKFEQNIPWETKVIFDDNIITGSKGHLTFEYYS